MENFIKYFKESSVSHAYIAVIFTATLVVVNVLQAFFLFVVKPFSLQMFRKLNYYVPYVATIQVLFLPQWWSHSRTILFSNPEHGKEYFGKEPALLLINHGYDIDFIFCSVLADNFNVAGNLKGFIKKTTLNLPLCGWALKFLEVVSVERNWEKDKQNVEKQLENLAAYRDPYWLLLFAEGARYTKEKHEESMKIARSKGLPELKHHLLPRTKGFVSSIKHLRHSMPAVYDVIVAVKPNQPHGPTVNNIARGRPITVNILLRRIPMDEIPEDETKAADWLHELYRQKDKLLDDFFKTGKFFPPGSALPNKFEGFVDAELPPCYRSLIIEVILFFLIGLPMFYWLSWRIFTGDWIVIVVSLSVVILVHKGLAKLVELTKIPNK